MRACGGVIAGVIPWIPAVPPAPPAPPAPPIAPACRASHLAVQLGLQGATGSSVGGILFRNSGARPCSLLGTVRVSLADGFDPAGVEVTANPGRTPPQPGVPMPSLRALRPGEHAFVEIWWSNWCGDVAPTRLAATLPSGDRIVLTPIPLVPRCDGPDAPSTVSVSRPEPWIAGAPSSTRLPLSAEIVERERVGPKVVPLVEGRRGGRAVFHVALTNTSSRSFRFGSSCPTYVEEAGWDSSRNVPLHYELHVLNCAPVRVLAPGRRVVFEMRIRVPRSLPAGSQSLTWELAPATYDPPFAGGVLQVT
jgi:Domain of unknown function (DUF4232)